MGSLQNLVIVMLVTSLFIISIGVFTGDIYSQYGNVQNVTYIDKSVALANEVSDMKDDINNQGIDDEGTEDSMFKGSWSALKKILSSLNIFESLINDTGSLLGISKEQKSILYAVVLVIILMTIIAVVTRTAAP